MTQRDRGGAGHGVRDGELTLGDASRLVQDDRDVFDGAVGEEPQDSQPRLLADEEFEEGRNDFDTDKLSVVLDLDETVMNNVEYQLRRERLGLGYTPESWYEWTQEESATLVPGVEAFLETVNTLGGHVAFVTNRSDSEQLATENNLADLGLVRGDDFQVLMTRARPNGVSAKDERYALVSPLLAAQGYPDVEIIAYLGDNVGDKPETEGEWTFFCIDQGAMYGDPCAAVPGPGQ